MKGHPITWLPEELAWIEARKDMPRADLHRAFVAFWQRPEITKAAISGLCKRKGWLTGRTGCFPKGNISHNKGKNHCPPGSEKGWFKPGQMAGRASALYRPIGTTRVADGYLQRKINDHALPASRRWRGVHLLNWEAINGPLPEGHCLKCLDGNKLNTDPANWIAIPRALLPRLTGRFGRDYDAAPDDLKPIILAITQLEHAARIRKQDARS